MRSLDHAQQLREIARSYERKGKGPEGQFYSCNAVSRRCGRDVAGAYAEVFDLEADLNAGAPWWMPDQHERDIRVLMLCFAAAMVETGDL